MELIKFPTPVEAFRVYRKYHIDELKFIKKGQEIKGIILKDLIGGRQSGDFGDGFNYQAKGCYEVTTGTCPSSPIYTCILKLSTNSNNEVVVDAIKDNTIIIS